MIWIRQVRVVVIKLGGVVVTLQMCIQKEQGLNLRRDTG
jgi:hypothetical protein